MIVNRITEVHFSVAYAHLDPTMSCCILLKHTSSMHAVLSNPRNSQLIVYIYKITAQYVPEIVLLCSSVKEGIPARCISLRKLFKEEAFCCFTTYRIFLNFLAFSFNYCNQ